MKILGFEFLSKEEKEKQRKEYSQQIFPFGEDAHKAKILETLRPVCSSKLKDQEILYVFITGKEKYLDAEPGYDGIAAIFTGDKLKRWAPVEDLRLITALIYLDCKTSSLDDYPTADDVRNAADGYPVADYFKNNKI